MGWFVKDGKFIFRNKKGSFCINNSSFSDQCSLLEDALAVISDALSKKDQLMNPVQGE